MSEEKSFTDRLTGIIREARKQGPELSGEGEWIGEEIDLQIEDSAKQNKTESSPEEEIAMLAKIALQNETETQTRSAEQVEATMKQEKSTVIDPDLDKINTVLVSATADESEDPVNETPLTAITEIIVEDGPTVTASTANEILHETTTPDASNKTGEAIDTTDISSKESRKSEETREELYKLAAILAVIRVASNGSEQAMQGRNLGTSFAQDHRRGMLGYANLASTRSNRSTWR